MPAQLPPPRIYHSDYPVPILPAISVFHYLFPPTPTASVYPQGSWSPSLPAFIDGVSSRVLSRGELRETALRVADGLRRLGVKPGDAATIWGANSLEWVLAAYGCVAAGVVVSPANAAYAPHELAHQMNDSGARVAFIAPDLLPTFEEARKELKYKDIPVVLLSDMPVRGHRVLADIYGVASEAVSFDGVRAHETAWLCYSSGTTGLPKGVMTTHHNITTQIQTTMPVFEKLESGRDVILGFLPLNHIYGTIYMLLLPLAYGIPTVLLPRFDELAALRAIQTHRVTLPLFVPPVVLRLLQSSNTAGFDLSSLRVVMSAAAPLQEDLSAAFENKFRVKVIQAYGMTEATPGITSMSSAMAPGRAGWSGRLMPTYQARLVDEGADVPPGQPGELWVRGPNIMKGYLGKEDCFEPGGWFRTGDVAVIDDEGWFKIVDRMKELIKYKGLQVAPAELEALLLEHPDIVDTGVIGVYDKAQVTELPRAYVVAAPGADRARLPAAVDAWVAARVAQHKRLRGGIVVIDEIPKSPSGKILRKELRARAEKEWEGAESKAKL
ncbi:acetyl-CoA synthetase-like protein [Cutaneotrichosporon oleaginosum]|uniref:Acetyl-CoA synthetase-like protein n=1 Tax=Cutaneotrichosporon oleaginosum TaxID=879819 RepID=A0A0J1B833_9TREE|nr:acetyl-CoA synthetase-like protein [Cutaneotrichosporon oleaginosum]KLT43929.1 acetyl-CoA synthetase-like protein [Cutaneotrichosporon oleaginosum]TXT04124.1 hypothetical protein COLE_07821 [Cutaneotrichosporon oleaginosum]